MAASAIGGVRCRLLETEGTLTWILTRGHFTCLDATGEYSLSLYILAYTSPLVAPSVLPINIENGAKATNEPGSRRRSPAGHREAREHFHRLERDQQVAPAPGSRITTAVAPRFP